MTKIQCGKSKTQSFFLSLLVIFFSVLSLISLPAHAQQDEGAFVEAALEKQQEVAKIRSQLALAIYGGQNREAAEVIHAAMGLSESDPNKVSDQVFDYIGMHAEKVYDLQKGREQMRFSRKIVDWTKRANARTASALNGFGKEVLNFYFVVAMHEFFECWRTREAARCSTFLDSLRMPETYIGFGFFVAGNRTVGLGIQQLSKINAKMVNGTFMGGRFAGGRLQGLANRVGAPVLNRLGPMAGMLGMTAGALLSHAYGEIHAHIKSKLHHVYQIRDPEKRWDERMKVLEETFAETFGSKEWQFQRVPDVVTLLFSSMVAHKILPVGQVGLSRVARVLAHKEFHGAAQSVSKIAEKISKAKRTLRGIQVVNGLGMGAVTKKFPLNRNFFSMKFLAKTASTFELYQFIWISGMLDPILRFWSERGAIGNLTPALVKLNHSLEVSPFTPDKQESTKKDLEEKVKEVQRRWDHFRSTQIAKSQEKMGLYVMDYQRFAEFVNRTKSYYSWIIQGMDRSSQQWITNLGDFHITDPKIDDAFQDMSVSVTQAFLNPLTSGTIAPDTITLKQHYGVPLSEEEQKEVAKREEATKEAIRRATNSHESHYAAAEPDGLVVGTDLDSFEEFVEPEEGVSDSTSQSDIAQNDLQVEGSSEGNEDHEEKEPGFLKRTWRAVTKRLGRVVEPAIRVSNQVRVNYQIKKHLEGFFCGLDVDEKNPFDEPSFWSSLVNFLIPGNPKASEHLYRVIDRQQYPGFCMEEYEDYLSEFWQSYYDNFEHQPAARQQDSALAVGRGDLQGVEDATTYADQMTSLEKSRLEEELHQKRIDWITSLDSEMQESLLNRLNAVEARVNALAAPLEKKLNERYEYYVRKYLVEDLTGKKVKELDQIEGRHFFDLDQDRHGMLTDDLVLHPNSRDREFKDQKFEVVGEVQETKAWYDEDKLVIEDGESSKSWMDPFGIRKRIPWFLKAEEYLKGIAGPWFGTDEKMTFKKGVLPAYGQEIEYWVSLKEKYGEQLAQYYPEGQSPIDQAIYQIAQKAQAATGLLAYFYKTSGMREEELKQGLNSQISAMFTDASHEVLSLADAAPEQEMTEDDYRVVMQSWQSFILPQGAELAIPTPPGASQGFSPFFR